ncbi:hypothetical protein HPB47_010157 [Ixodes persulcatus]|uniref:Uncharacterized protein n=1 Tax=Ixodes persulcatus TaxID=34615 RepID=A0AC60P078_IXOPE|nr:hypothetical protein HPB47_010157 [Ixodes persulcatus]
MADDCISLLLGNFGPWHVLLVFLVASSNFFLALNTIGSAFLLPSELPFHCSEHNATEDVDACELRRRGRCGTVVFDQTEYRSTAVEDFELVCKRRWLSSLSQSLAMAGLAVGALAFGRFADRGGRRASLLLGATVHVLGCLLSLAASGVGIYALSRLVTSLGAASATCCLSTGLSIALPSWRALHGVMLIHGALVFSCSLLVHESPRWLLSRGRVEDAQEALRGIATFNGVHRGKIAAHIPKLLQQYEASAAAEAPACLPSLRDLLCTSRSLGLYTLFMWFQAVVLGLVYYTSSLTGTSLGGRPQLDFACLSATELACNLAGCAASRYLPRRTTMASLAATLACAQALLLACSGYAARLGVGLVVRGAVSSYFLVCFLHLQESYPTGIRGLGVSVFQCVFWGSAALDPFARNALGTLLPAVYVAALLVCCPVVLCLVRETLGRSLADESPPCADGGDRCAGQLRAEPGTELVVQVLRF